MKSWRAAALAVVFGCSDPEPVLQGWAAAFDARDAGWLMNVWGPRGDALFAVGGRPSEGRVYRYDGRAWSRVPLGVDVPLLNWVWGFGADDVTAVGNGGTVLHWDGRAWTRQPTPRAENLWGVWGASSSDLWAVGGNGAADDRPVLLHWDGAAWSDVAIPHPAARLGGRVLQGLGAQRRQRLRGGSARRGAAPHGRRVARGARGRER